jgi:hypothetical protein
MGNVGLMIITLAILVASFTLLAWAPSLFLASIVAGLLLLWARERSTDHLDCSPSDSCDNDLTGANKPEH